MNNLFSIFNPSANFLFFFQWNWLSLIYVVLVFPTFYWVTPSQQIKRYKLLLNYIYEEFNRVLIKIRLPGIVYILISLFIFITLNNFLGLFPYIFTATRHLSTSCSLALPMWVGHFVYNWIIQFEFILAHLVPLRTPYALMPFIVIIELIRGLIRPLTLSVRLAANIIAGHLLLTLLGNQAPLRSYFIFFNLIVALFLIALLECAVAIIQAYVFRILSTLYLNEVNSYSLLKI